MIFLDCSRIFTGRIGDLHPYMIGLHAVSFFVVPPCLWSDVQVYSWINSSLSSVWTDVSVDSARLDRLFDRTVWFCASKFHLFQDLNDGGSHCFAVCIFMIWFLWFQLWLFAWEGQDRGNPVFRSRVDSLWPMTGNWRAYRLFAQFLLQAMFLLWNVFFWYRQQQVVFYSLEYSYRACVWWFIDRRYCRNIAGMFFVRVH